MFCYKCGKEITGDAAFCPYCGTKIMYSGESPSSTVDQIKETDNNINYGIAGFIPSEPGVEKAGQSGSAVSDNYSNGGFNQQSSSNFSNNQYINNGQAEYEPNSGGQNPNFDGQNSTYGGQVIDAFVTLKTGSWTVLGMMNNGHLKASVNGISYSASIGGKAHDHTYTYKEIAGTKFAMTRVGLQPLFGYTVTLKNGQSYTYTYSPLRKSTIEKIDTMIKNNM